MTRNMYICMCIFVSFFLNVFFKKENKSLPWLWNLKSPTNLTYSYTGGSFGFMLPLARWQQNSICASPKKQILSWLHPEHNEVYMHHYKSCEWGASQWYFWHRKTKESKCRQAPIEEAALFPALGQCKINLPLHSKVIKCNPFYW